MNVGNLTDEEIRERIDAITKERRFLSCEKAYLASELQRRNARLLNYKGGPLTEVAS